jgi:hypothetical protein
MDQNESVGTEPTPDEIADYFQDLEANQRLLIRALLPVIQAGAAIKSEDYHLERDVRRMARQAARRINRIVRSDLMES